MQVKMLRQGRVPSVCNRKLFLDTQILLSEAEQEHVQCSQLGGLVKKQEDPPLI